MTLCECCKKDYPESMIFSFYYNKRKYLVCSFCYPNIEEYIINRRNLKTVLDKEELKRVQLENKIENEKIENIDFSTFPREFLEDLLKFIKDKGIIDFKKLLKEYEERNQIKIF